MIVKHKIWQLVVAILMFGEIEAIAIGPVNKAFNDSVIGNKRTRQLHRNQVVIEDSRADGLADSPVNISVVKRADHTSASKSTKSSDEDADTAMPTISDNAASYTYDVQVPNATGISIEDPYLYRSRFPMNFVFMVIAGIILLMLLCTFSFYIVTSLMSRQVAGHDKYTFSSDFNGSFIGSEWSQTELSSSNASLFRRNSVGSINSAPILMNRGSVFFSNPSASNLFETSEEPRRYKDRVVGNRASMFVSPVMELMANANVNSTDHILPLHNDTYMNERTPSLYYNFFNFEGSQESTSEFEGRASLEKLVTGDCNSSKTHRRTPSQYLDDLINRDSIDSVHS